MTEFLWSMGPFLVPLIALSVYGIGLILVKVREWKGCLPLAPDAFAALLDGLDSRGVEHGLEPAHPLAKLLDRSEQSPHRRQAWAQAQLARFEDRLSYFPALANIATLAGLFGTVCGMIAAFLALRSGGGADPSSLAGGLGQALVATALGLVTAIPSLTAHAVFQKRTLALGAQMEALLSAQLTDSGESSGA